MFPCHAFPSDQKKCMQFIFNFRTTGQNIPMVNLSSTTKVGLHPFRISFQASFRRGDSLSWCLKKFNMLPRALWLELFLLVARSARSAVVRWRTCLADGPLFSFLEWVWISCSSFGYAIIIFACSFRDAVCSLGAAATAASTEVWMFIIARLFIGNEQNPLCTISSTWLNLISDQVCLLVLRRPLVLCTLAKCAQQTFVVAL